LVTSAVEEDSSPALFAPHGVGDRAEGSGTEIGVQMGGHPIDVHRGEPLGTGRHR
jgi:hypothetical protein